ncbi:glyoxylase-like metal-dependent hydrolase (beta-lactamase superfamily II) [Brevibacterium paucivorans]|uniref:Glyoxylase-like metal-dependent hydrolase (Beta-lactamase superfamily II) n=1 Tax=Brevibacterium paucivorans TaxID=170994 RepID=A0ABS2SIJ8_9MICO|nr:MBL fold metallo-hydrolase [Brevibacterium paucivorans]MBM7816080.1 glyoxylase-like metal-dependent hydrolase (beta-lactamase superfamily II) [Brevibacterium paucivorans]
MTARIERLITSGTFSLDGGTWDVDNNVWIVGDDAEVVVIDPAHDPELVSDKAGTRFCERILLTHGHDDHIRYALETKDALGGIPVCLNSEDSMLWDAVFPDVEPDENISAGNTFRIAGLELQALHTPGHSPGSTCFYIESGLTLAQLPNDLGQAVDQLRKELGENASTPVLLSGDTLFAGGPGATGRSYSSFDTIIDSIRSTLFELPDSTVVLTGHGDATTIGAERPHLSEWIARGH